MKIIVSSIKGLLGLIEKKDKSKKDPYLEDAIRGAFFFDEMHPVIKALRRQKCKK